MHGAYAAAWCWDEHFLSFFAGHGYACHALSFSGHGGSAGRERLDSFGIDHYVQDVARVVAQLPAPPVLIGHSMGGMVAQKYLERRPQGRPKGGAAASLSEPNGGEQSSPPSSGRGSPATRLAWCCWPRCRRRGCGLPRWAWRSSGPACSATSTACWAAGAWHSIPCAKPCSPSRWERPTLPAGTSACSRSRTAPSGT
ncbi:MAG: lysophospholipase [Rhodocyclaceae bacterium]|nr:lysophospholipase [Rhodocyclaceae bacterium]